MLDVKTKAKRFETLFVLVLFREDIFRGFIIKNAACTRLCAGTDACRVGNAGGM
jgi:hypothetical protein